jgi:AMIN domain-containing protein
MQAQPEGRNRDGGSRADRILFYAVAALGFGLLVGMVWIRPGGEAPEPILTAVPAQEGPESVAAEMSLLGLDAGSPGGASTPMASGAPAPEQAADSQAPAVKEPHPPEPAANTSAAQAPAVKAPAAQGTAPSDEPFSVEVAVPGSTRHFRLLRLDVPPGEVRHFSLADPARIVVDLAQAVAAPDRPESFKQIQVENEELRPWLLSVRIGAKGRQTRLVLDLATPASYELRREPGKVLLTLGMPAS